MTAELLTMGVSTVLGFVLKYLSNQQQDTYTLLKADRESRAEASTRSDGVWVRRFIVLIMMFVFAFIVVGPAFVPGLQTIIVEQGWLFTTTTEVKGIMYDATTKEILLSIIGYYFGTSAASRR